jgi:hypothetical protein
VIVVSNAAGYPHAVLMERYRRLGYRFDPDDVVTSRKAALRALAMRWQGRWGLVADPAYGRAELEGLEMVFLGDDLAEHDAADGILFLGAARWTDARQALLVESLRRQLRPVIVANPDLVAPRDAGLSREPGARRFPPQEPEHFSWRALLAKRSFWMHTLAGRRSARSTDSGQAPSSSTQSRRRGHLRRILR